MDEKVARELLDREIAALRVRSYESLRDGLLKESEVKEIIGPDGKWYQMEIQAFWDDRRGGDLRVMVGIGDGTGWRLFPLYEDFIISPSGEFVGE